MSEELLDEVASDTDPLGVIDLSTVVPFASPSKYVAEGTGRKIENSKYCFEVVRMILDGLTYVEISERLRSIFHFNATDFTIAAFKKNFYSLFRDLIDRVDKSRHQYLVARITEEMKEAARRAVHEVFELESLLVVVDERIKLLRNLSDARQNASYESVLNSYIRTRGDLLKRMTEITGSSGLEEAKKDAVKRTALAAQKTLIPYLIRDKKDDAFILFEQELEEILRSIDSGLDVSPPTR